MQDISAHTRQHIVSNIYSRLHSVDASRRLLSTLSDMNLGILRALFVEHVPNLRLDGVVEAKIKEQLKMN